MHLGAHLVGDHVGHRGFAEARGPIEQHVVERLAALPGGVEGDAELFTNDLLANALVEPSRAQRVEIALILGPAAFEDSFDGHGCCSVTGGQMLGGQGVGRSAPAIS